MGNFEERRFEVPTTEREDYKQHRESSGKAPGAGAAGTVHARGGKDGPTKEELARAAVDWLKANRPDVLFFKVEAMFDQRQIEIVWTPTYCPEFQPIELIWGAAKQRASGMYFVGRFLLDTRLHLRMGFYGDPSASGKAKGGVYVVGACAKAESEMNAWIAKDKDHVADYLSGTNGKVEGSESYINARRLSQLHRHGGGHGRGARGARCAGSRGRGRASP